MDIDKLAQQFGGSQLGSQPINNSVQNSTQPISNSSNPDDLAKHFGGQQLGAENQPQTNQPQQSFLSKVGNFLGVTPAGQDIGQAMASGANADLYTNSVKQYSDVTNNLLKAIKSKQESGGDTSRLQNALQQHLQEAPKMEDFQGDAINKTGEQIAGDFGQLALGATAGGGLESGIGALKAVGIGNKLAQGAKIGATYGAIGGATNAMSNNQDLGGVAQSTAIGGALGAGLGIGGEALGAGIGKVASNYLTKEGLTGKLGETYNDILNLTGKQQAKQNLYGKDAGEHMANLVAEGGQFPLSNKEGNLNTTGAIENLKRDFIKPENEMADKLVASENKYIPLNGNGKTPSIKGIFNDVVNQYSGDELLTAQNRANRILKAYLQDPKYTDKIITMPNGDKNFPLEVVNQMRKDFWAKSKSAFNSTNQDKLFANINYKLGHAMRDVVINQSESPLIKDLLSRLGDHQNLLGVLEQRGDKPIGMSIVKRYVSKFTAGALGNMVAGHGGGLVGYWSGDKLAQLVENPNIDTFMIKKLLKLHPIQEPEILQHVNDLLEKRDKIMEYTKYPMNVPQRKEVLQSKLTNGVNILPKGEKPLLTNTTSFEPQAQNIHRDYGNFLDEVANNKNANVTYNPNAEVTAQIPETNNITAPAGGNINNKNSENITKGNISNTIQNLKDKVNNIPNKQGGFATGIGYKNEGNLTTKILKDLEGKTTVSKQYILDATNRGELKQAERDITRQVLDTMKGDTVNVKEFADKVKSELLPLKVTDEGNKFGNAKYESITLPKELRGNIKNYKENVYQSPIKTSAGDTHFSGKTDNYFGHTRIEDMADNKTRRVIEVQSDLYQKGNLEREINKRPIDEKSYLGMRREVPTKESIDKGVEKLKKEGFEDYQIKQYLVEEKSTMSKLDKRTQEIAKLQQYNDPTAHFRMIREEIKKASQDGKTKLQFPTGETAMNIEGLVNRSDKWVTLDNKLVDGNNIKNGDLITFQEHEGTPHPDRRFLITKNTGNGNFYAVDSMTADNDSTLYDILKKKGLLDDGRQPSLEELHNTGALDDKDVMAQLNKLSEHLSAKDTVDTNNPIYKFYEKDVSKYLNKFGGKRVIDDKGVSWIEIPITKEQGKAPVEAFGKAKLGVVGTGALVGAGAVGANKLAQKKK